MSNASEQDVQNTIKEFVSLPLSSLVNVQNQTKSRKRGNTKARLLQPGLAS